METYLESTLFYFMEASTGGLDGKPVRVMMDDEIRIMLLNDLAEQHELTALERMHFCYMVGQINSRAVRLTSKPMTGGEGSRYMLHCIIVPRIGADPAVHQTDKISVTAGCGKRDWDHWTHLEQMDVQNFVFDLNDKAGDPEVPLEIKLKMGRLTTVVTVGDMVKN